jgi:hypothetical protein
VRVPEVLTRTWAHEQEWLGALPELAAELAERWELTLEAPIETPHSLVVPAGDAVLKLNAPSHVEADREADALERWAGSGAVRLLHGTTTATRFSSSGACRGPGFGMRARTSRRSSRS